MDIYYVNSKGSRIDFSEWPIAVEDVTQLFAGTGTAARKPTSRGTERG